MIFSSFVRDSLLLLALVKTAFAHGYHSNAQQEPMGAKDWATEHMREEHHIDNFDANSFFTLHDFDNNGVWTPDEVRRLYGLDDESNKDVTEARRQQIIHDVFNIYDEGGTGQITREEWLYNLNERDRRLPDFGLGPGHHGDDEYEYEIHHFEKYHDENTREEDLIHPEDIEHFKKHDQLEDEAERIERMGDIPIVEENIPQKFRRAA